MPDVDLQFQELGSSGLTVLGGLVHEETLRQLQDPVYRNDTYRRMMDDAIVGAVLLLVDLLVRNAEWSVEPAEGDDSPQGKADAEFVWECFQDLNRPWRDVVAEFLSVVPFGWAWHEIVFKRRLGPQPDPVQGADGIWTQELPGSRFSDGKIGWHKFAGRMQDTLSSWIFDQHGDVVAMVQRAPPHYRDVMIPLSRSLHFRTTTRGNNPEGRSMLARAYRSWYYKTRIEEFLAIGVERDLAGTPMIGVPGEYMKANPPANIAAERASLEKLIRNLKRGEKEGIIYPLVYDEKGNKRYEIELLTTGGRRQFDIRGLMQYYDQRIAMMTLGDVVLLGHEKVGSYALADAKTENPARFAHVLLDMIADQFSRRAIPRLLALNGRPIENPSRLVHGDVETLSLEALGRYIQVLTGAGYELFPSKDGELERALMAAADLPGGDEDL